MSVLEAVREKIPPNFEAMAHDLRVKATEIADPDPLMLADTVPPPILEEDRPKPDSDNGVHIVTAEEIPQVAQSLAEGFNDDPHFSFMLRDEDKRLPRLGHGILSFIQHDWLPNGVVHTNKQLSGAAVWTEPGKWQADIAAQAHILKSLAGVVTPAEIARLAYVLGFVESKHAEIERLWSPHRYLAMVGVTTEWQGMGWGEALIRPMLNQCDKDGTPAYLEAATPRNVRLYKRLGFKVIATGRYRGAQVPLQFMWREPQS